MLKESLGIMEPVSWTVDAICHQMFGVLRGAGYTFTKDNPKGFLEVRTPEVNRACHPELRDIGWHRDGCSEIYPFWLRDTLFADFSGMLRHIALWASCDPTEILPHPMLQQPVWRPRPCEVVVFSNVVFFHRAPPIMPTGRERWFARVVVEKEVK